MIRRGAIVWLGGVLLAAPAIAAPPPPAPLRGTVTTPVRTAPLAPGEQLLELGALGVATARADRATFTVTLQVEAVDFTAAQILYRARVAQLRAALGGLGLPANAVRVPEEEPPGPVTSQQGLHVDNADAIAAMEAMEEVAAAASGEPRPRREQAPRPIRFSASVEVRVDAMARVHAVGAALDGFGASDVSGPVYWVSDPSAALRSAGLNALARVRARAEAAAAASNMRVTRVVRVSQRNPTDFFRVAYADGGALPARRSTFDMFESESSPDIDVAVLIGAEFALVPR